MQNLISKLRSTLTLLPIVLVLTIGPGYLYANQEVAEDLSASEVLPAELLSGPHYSIDERVENDGYLNYYTIRSDYGVFEAASTAMLRVRLKEIEALSKIDELSGTEVFITAAADAGLDQLRVIGTFVTTPVSSLAALPQGVSRMFKQSLEKADKALADTKDYIASQKDLGLSDRAYADYKKAATELTKRYLKVSDAERELAEELEVDPYTSNETLRNAIAEVALVDKLGRTAMRYSGLRIPYIGLLSSVNKAVWGKDVRELREYNRDRLKAIGADEKLVDSFLKNPWISPTQQTLLAQSIEVLDGVKDRHQILRQSLNLKTKIEVGYFVRAVALLAWYHGQQHTLASVSTELAIPGGIRSDGTTVLLFPSDYVYWTGTMAQAAREYRQLGKHKDDHKSELWILGSVSDRTQTELLKMGYELHTNMEEILNE